MGYWGNFSGMRLNGRPYHALAGLWLAVLWILLAPLAQAQDEEAATPASSYVDLKPAFVVNYGGAGRLRYLKTSIALRVNTPGIEPVRRHMPYLRHRLIMLLSNASEEDLSSMEGKELLRQSALEAVREVLMQEEGEQQVLDLLFNSFIVQR